MPVFGAFGWAGEENAINFALDQLELFITELHLHLSKEARLELPHHGIDREAQTIFLSSKREAEEGPYIAFLARPLTLEMRFSVTDRAVINRGLRAAEKNPADWYRYLNKLGENWSLHLQQNHVDEETNASSYYQDIFKNDVANLDIDTCQTMTTRAAFLNSEPSWVTPIYISYRIPSDIAAGMNGDIVNHLATEIDRLMPILFLFTHSKSGDKSKGKKSVAKSKSKSKSKTAASAKSDVANDSTGSNDSFTYISELKPLHLRKGFINLTPEHWPFFAESARSETRQVTVFFEGDHDATCAVWRLQPTDMARIILSEKAQMWLEDNFPPDSEIQVKGTRLSDNNIQISLESPE